MSGLSPEAPPLVERDTEVEAIRAALTAAASGEGRLVVAEGIAGIGKSRLLAEASRTAAEQGLKSLSARGTESEQGFPFGIALQLFELHVRRATEDEREALLQGVAGGSRDLFDGTAWERLARDSNAVFSLVHSLYWLVANLADRGPLCLLVDDAQWADPASLRFLSFLAQRIGDMPVVLIAGIRTGEPASVRDEVSALARHPGATALTPRALTEAGVTAVVRAAHTEAAEEFCARCSTVTGGNPFMLHELVLALEGERIEPVSEMASAIDAITPEAVLRSVVVRLSRFPAETVALARALAVLGGDVNRPEYAAEMAGVPSVDAAVRAATTLAEAGILSADGRMAFDHPLLRSAVYGDIGEAERGRAHAQAAAILHRAGERDERVAAQLLLAPPSGEPWAAPVLCAAAARNSAQGAPGAAADCLLRALREPLSDAERSAVTVELGRAELAAGREAGIARIEAAVDQLEPRQGAKALAELGGFHHTQGRLAEAAAAFTRGAELVEGADDALEHELLAGRALAAMWEPAMRDEALQGVAPLLNRTREPGTLGERLLLLALSTVEIFGGADRERGADLALRAWGDGAFIEDGGATHPAVSHLVGGLSHSDEFAAGEAICDALVAETARMSRPLEFANASYLRGALLYHHGRITEAAGDLELALEVDPLGWDFYGPTARALLALCQRLRNEVAAADRLLEIPADLAETAEESPLWGAFWIARAHANISRDPAVALAAAERAGEMLASLGLVNPSVFAWRSPAALALARLGELDRARALADEELALVEAFGAPRAIAVAARARGLVEPGDEGLKYLERAVEVSEGSDAYVARAEALLALGAVLRRHRGPRASLDPLRAALEAADRAGASALTEQARSELSAAGSRPRRTARSGVDALTPGELRVVRLAADGLTNREIAEALFVTRKTVDWHLRGAYRKLDVNSRQALAPLLSGG